MQNLAKDSIYLIDKVNTLFFYQRNKALTLERITGNPALNDNPVSGPLHTYTALTNTLQSNGTTEANRIK